MTNLTLKGAALAAALLLSAALAASAAHAATCTTTPWDGMGGVPALTDYPPGYLYLGTYAGFLYDGSNDPPADHDAAGRSFAALIKPRDAAGVVCTAPGPGCRIVFLSIGFSNNTIEFCGGQGIGGDPEAPSATPCPLPTAQPPYLQTQSFIAKALGDPAVDHAAVVPVDGAMGGQTYEDWDPIVSGSMEYDRVLNTILTPSGLSPAQVQAIWIKDAEARPTVSLATGSAGNPPDAILAERHLGNILRGLRTFYPSLQQVFVSPRIYGGYANTASPPNDLNPEPFAYEIGFAIKWLVGSQIAEVRGGIPDPNAGDLDYTTAAAPWVAWGPSLWANGTTPRSDGLVWLNTDLRGPRSDGTFDECTHPSTYGEDKVSGMLLAFMKASPFTRWFLAPSGPCALLPDSLRIGADRQTITWSATGTPGPFDVARGDLNLLHAAGGDYASAVCRANDLTAPLFVDASLPPPGEGGYWLARCTGGTWNDGTETGNRDLTLLACP
jgi:hypothetical protein